MPPVGSDRDARAHAHYKWAERYARAGDTSRSRAHFGRALDYTFFGGNDELLQSMPKNIKNRITSDIRNIVAAGLADSVDLEYDGKTLLMKFTRNIDRASIIVRVPEWYPFKSPGVYIDGRKAPEDWRSPSDTIINVLQRYAERSLDKKVLILCHAKPVRRIDDAAYGHWLGKLPAHDGKEETIYDSIMSMHAPDLKSNKPVSFFTVDNLEHDNEADYKADAFDPSFANEHVGEYDAILVPDCGGSWYEVVYNNKGNAESLAGQCVQMMSMLKRGGFIFFSKMSESFQRILNGALERAGYGVLDYEISGLGPVLAATRAP